MTAFVLSGTIAFALYELMAFAEWPSERSYFRYYQATLRLSEEAARAVRRIIRSLIAIVILLAILTLHDLVWPVNALARYEINIIFGFVFGPLFAMWVNSVIVHSPGEDLTRGQIFAAIALVVLFIAGAIGSESSGLLRQYARNLASVKLGVAELSFTAKDQGNRERIASTVYSGESRGTYVAEGSNGLQNLTVLDGIIKRDRDYLKDAFTPKSLTPAIDDLDRSEQLAKSTIGLPMTCLFAWSQQTADDGPVEKYLSTYSDAFRRLEALSRRASAADHKLDSAGLDDVSTDFVRNGLGMAADISRSSLSKAVLGECRKWFEIYCQPDKKPPASDQDDYARQCLHDKSRGFAPHAGATGTDEVQERIDFLARNLGEMIAPRLASERRGLESLPYFAIARASLMTQLGQHAAAAAVLDDWLGAADEENRGDERQKQYQGNPALQIRDEWFVLRVRAMLAAYVEEWLDDASARAATVVRTEHLRNLKATIDGFKARLLKADFFKKLNEQCGPKCEPAFRRPAICDSDEPPARLKLWRQLYSSYLTMEYTYIHRALEHPDYAAKFAEAVNDEARRLVNFDLSCGSVYPTPETLYGQSLLGFAENAVAYARLRARTDDQVTQQKRLDEAEHAVKLGLQIVDDEAKKDQERSGKPFLERIASSLAVSIQEQLRQQLAAIEKSRADLAE